MWSEKPAKVAISCGFAGRRPLQQELRTLIVTDVYWFFAFCTCHSSWLGRKTLRSTLWYFNKSLAGIPTLQELTASANYPTLFSCNMIGPWVVWHSPSGLKTNSTKVMICKGGTHHGNLEYGTILFQKPSKFFWNQEQLPSLNDEFWDVWCIFELLDTSFCKVTIAIHFHVHLAHHSVFIRSMSHVNMNTLDGWGAEVSLPSDMSSQVLWSLLRPTWDV